MSDQHRFTEDAWRNRQANVRARQRARHRTAMHFHREYDRELAAEMDVPGISRGTAKARAMQAVVTAHRSTFRRFMDDELTKEDVVDLPRGRQRIFPCGTETAWRYHKRLGDDPLACDECRAWYEKEFERVCKTCEGTFISRQSMTFCDRDCRFIWDSCLRYYEEFTRHAVWMARSKLRNGTLAEQANARRRLGEYRRTGRIERRREPFGPKVDSVARQLAEAKGLDLEDLIALASEKPA